jgi:hypothetical protein
LTDNSDFPDNKGDNLANRLENAIRIQQLTDELSDPENLKEHPPMKWVHTPGRGNCFLWSCVTAESVFKSGEHSNQEMERIGKMGKIGIRTDKDLITQKDLLREGMVDNLKERRAKNDPDFEQRLRTHIATLAEDGDLNFNDTQLATLEQAAMEIMLDPEYKLPKDIIAKYLEELSTNGSWNSEFEGDLVADILERPIILYQRQGQNGPIEYKTICGSQFLLDHTEPICALHIDGLHWEMLRYANL